MYCIAFYHELLIAKALRSGTCSEASPGFVARRGTKRYEYKLSHTHTVTRNAHTACYDTLFIFRQNEKRTNFNNCVTKNLEILDIRDRRHNLYSSKAGYCFYYYRYYGLFTRKENQSGFK